jgi:hypothetical protein
MLVVHGVLRSGGDLQLEPPMLTTRIAELPDSIGVFSASNWFRIESVSVSYKS